MPKAKYAIFLPVLNGARYIREAVDSIVAQTLDNWVLVVLDNASTDRTVELVSAYRHPNIHIHRSSAFLSMWDSWHRVWSLLSNAAVAAEFVTFIGHDDRLLPDFLKTIDQLTVAHPSASLYQTAYNIIDAEGNLIRPCRPIPPVESSADFLKARCWGLRDSCGTGYVFRSAEYVAVGGIPKLPQLLFADDLLFARLTNLRGKIASNATQFEYRLHRWSASNTITRGRICAYVSAIDAYVDMIQGEFPGICRRRHWSRGPRLFVGSRNHGDASAGIGSAHAVSDAPNDSQA